MIDIYNLDPDKHSAVKNPVELELTCHTDYGNKNDERGRFFEKGKKYKAKFEPIRPQKDTNYKPCTLVWISFNEGYGSRFAVVGNITVTDWPHFTRLFNCPIEEMRNNKIEDLLWPSKKEI